MSFISHIKEEFQVIQERDRAIKTPLEVLLYPSFRVMIKYRRAHKLYLKGHYFLARWISQRAARKTGIEIHPGATIGNGRERLELKFTQVHRSGKDSSLTMGMEWSLERQRSSEIM